VQLPESEGRTAPNQQPPEEQTSKRGSSQIIPLLLLVVDLRPGGDESVT
jgi:hypothetical protein